MLVADRDLDQPLERLALAALGVAPRRLEQLVNLEVEVRVEERRGRVQNGAARAQRRGRARGERGRGGPRTSPARPG